MSLISGTDMAVIIRDNANKLVNLMQEYAILDRMLDKEMNLEEVFATKINWDETHEQILKRRYSSMDYLHKMITKCI